VFSGSSLTLSYTNFIVVRIYAEALDRLRVRLNMYLVSNTNGGIGKKDSVIVDIHRVSKKLCQIIFCSLSVQREPISIKIGNSVPV